MGTSDNPVSTDITWREPVESDAAALEELEAAVMESDDADFNALLIPKELPPTGGRVAHAGFLPDGRMVALAVFTRNGSADSATLRLVIRPSYRRMGLEEYLIGWAQDQAQGKRSLVIADEHLTMETDFLYNSLGFQRTLAEDVMRLDLRKPLPSGPHPRNVNTVEWNSDSQPLFYQTYVDSFNERPGFPNWTQKQWVDWLTDKDFRPDLSLLAMVQDDPAAFILSHYDKKDTGWITQVGVKHCYRRTGLAAMLVGEVVKQLAREGADWAMLDVNEDNLEAKALYDKLGFETVRRRGKYEKLLPPRT